MQFVVITRENWANVVRQSGIRLEILAAGTGKSYSAVYRYLRGDRRPSDRWIAQVAEILSREAA